MLQKIVFLPVGSYEYHGSLLPPETDSLIAGRLADDLHKSYEDSYLLPTLNYGISTEHNDFNSTVTVNNSSYLSFMSTLLGSVSHENSLIVIINGHGGNVNILSAIEAEYNYKNNRSKLLVPTIYNDSVVSLCNELLGEFDTHAGSVESSLVAYYGHGKKDRFVSEDEDYIKKMSGSLRFFRTAQLSKKGIIKDTNRLVVDPKLGKELHGFIVKQLKLEINKTTKDINRISRGV